MCTMMNKPVCSSAMMLSESHDQTLPYTSLCRPHKARVKLSRLPPARYKARTTLFWILWEAVISSLMLASIALWFLYAIQLV